MSLTLPHLKFNDRGEEIMDKTPVSKSMRFKPQSEYARIRALIRAELSQEANNQGFETEAEANDFSVGDDFDPSTPYEETFDPESGVSNFERKFSEEKPIDQTASKKGDGDLDPHVDNPIDEDK